MTLNSKSKDYIEKRLSVVQRLLEKRQEKKHAHRESICLACEERVLREARAGRLLKR